MRNALADRPGRVAGLLLALALLSACSKGGSTAAGGGDETSGGDEADGMAKAVPITEDDGVVRKAPAPIDQPIPQAEVVAVEVGPPKLDPEAASIWGAPDAEAGNPLPPRTPMNGAAKSAYVKGVNTSDGNPQAATAAFQKALSADGKSYEAAFNLGVMADRAGQTDRALKYYQQSLSLQPDYERAVEGVVRIYLRQGSPAQAVAFVEPIANKWERNLYLQAILAEALVEADRVDEAEQAARRALRRHEKFVPAMIALARASLKRGRTELAESILKQALVLDENHPEIHFLQGLASREQGHLAEAMQSFAKAVQLRPDYAEAHMALGLQYMVGGNYPQAQKEFEAVVRLTPTVIAGHLNLGDAYRANGKWEDAKRELDRALRMDPNLAAAHYNLGLMYMSAGADFPQLDQLEALNRALLEFNNYRQKMGANLRKDDPSSTYMVDIERAIERENKRIEREKKAAEREARKKAMEAEGGGE